MKIKPTTPIKLPIKTFNFIGLLKKKYPLKITKTDTVENNNATNPEVTKFVVENGQKALNWLTETGVNFTTDSSSKKLHLTREGGHSHRRIAHVADTTGRAIQDRLIESVLSHPNIDIFENHIAVDLITSSKIDIKTNNNICYPVAILSDTSIF